MQSYANSPFGCCLSHKIKNLDAMPFYAGVEISVRKTLEKVSQVFA
jgi:hypothetical protein